MIAARARRKSPLSRAAAWGGLALVLLTPGLALAQLHREATLLPDFVPLAPSAYADRGDGSFWEGRVAAPASLYVRLHFTDVTVPAGAEFEIVLRGADERALARYGPADLARAREFWSDVLFSPSIRVRVEASTAPAGLSFRVDHVLRQIDLQGRMTPQSILPSWKALDELRSNDPALALSPSIAKLYVGEGFVCTGFLVSPKGLLTNHHCLEKSVSFQATLTQAQPSCQDIEVQFDFDKQPRPAASVRTACAGILKRDEELDFALLELDATAILRNGNPRPILKLADRKTPQEGEPVYAIHHPAGLAKKVSADCKVYPTSSEKPVEHDCSTAGGSSGAPLVSRDGQVVALHFEGAYPRNMTAGQIEAELMAGKVFRNKAEPMHLVRERLKELLP